MPTTSWHQSRDVGTLALIGPPATARAMLRLVTEDEMAEDFSQFELGAIPPLGEMLPAPEIIDRRVLEHDRILCNGGDHTRSVLLDQNDIVRASDARVADVSEAERG
jgi:prolyl-tRNA editing enzyme YbaK/EbsC (Cys-tRNA(Pro) deacylase)